MSLKDRLEAEVGRFNELLKQERELEEQRIGSMARVKLLQELVAEDESKALAASQEAERKRADRNAKRRKAS
jgi:cell division protein ZapA (FtsZ GTPase activity inhibitor)